MNYELQIYNLRQYIILKIIPFKACLSSNYVIFLEKTAVSARRRAFLNTSDTVWYNLSEGNRTH